MAEGLDPIEVGKKLTEHADAAHEESKAEGGHGESDDRHSRIVQIAEAVLLALVTIAAAWAGYSAAQWARFRGSTSPSPRRCATSPPATTSPPSRSATSMPRPSTRG